MITDQLQFRFFKKSLDDLEDSPGTRLGRLKANFFKFRFVEVYEFIEFVLALDQNADYESFRRLCNSVLERDLAAVRLVGKQFVSITNETDLEEISEAIGNSYSNSVATHISFAASLYSQSPNPDYRNSIKESVSAVEAAVRFVTGKKTMGVAKPLKLIENEFEIHGALRDGFEKIFAFSSDAEGVRHALMDKSNSTQADARFMLVACSAFSNYLLSLKAQQG